MLLIIEKNTETWKTFCLTERERIQTSAPRLQSEFPCFGRNYKGQAREKGPHPEIPASTVKGSPKILNK
ncbi:hypothetical protein D1164_08160 [Mariniphaga sediminis]|uniref:Uncharacterized protein n=1 Tax=Mariniphaga sediminis TaxID=1628158 RepID=A0A399D5B9_9BACT|nr:hypothetical protein D1164_08160 [Mariniphaga sediminis]